MRQKPSTSDPRPISNNTTGFAGQRSHQAGRAANRFGRIALLASLCWAIPAAASAQSCAIAKPGKFGVGAWATQGSAQLTYDLKSVQTRWWYDWQARPSASKGGYVPMIWSDKYLNYAAGAPGTRLLTFNEPDNWKQANMSVGQALSYWPQLMATGKMLSSPAVQTGNELGNGWLGKFMAEVKRRNYTVDFIAVHYYSTNRSVPAFKYYLQSIYNAYKKPIWVTEWALADWSNPSRFTVGDQTTFFTDSVEMMDDLYYVQKHAWFGLYEGLDSWHIRSGLIDNKGRTGVGDAFRREVTC